MGNSSSLMLQDDEIQAISAETGFSRNQIVRLYSRFLSLDKQGRGYLDRDDFLRIPELAINPLGDRIIDAFLLKLAFSMYDLNKNGFITRDEFKVILNMMVGANITAEQLESIADRTISEADIDNDGKISFDEFCRAMDKTDIEQKMSIRFLN
ncbi:Ethanol sensitive with low memory, isoform A [Dirofilaria immitis]|nr:Ethanol sensitive with low memory, isoform A [Dirofilaria immitis]